MAEEIKRHLPVNTSNFLSLASNNTSPLDRTQNSVLNLPPGTSSDCALYYRVTGADYITGCMGIETEYGISHAVFSSLNPVIDARCTNLEGGFDYCVAGKLPTPTPNPFRTNEYK